MVQFEVLVAKRVKLVRREVLHLFFFFLISTGVFGLDEGHGWQGLFEPDDR
jgi:hypothetical protein